jgi:hypothetical protein
MYIIEITNELIHDHGQVKLKTKTVAEKLDFVEALKTNLEIIQNSENCPLSAIKKISISLSHG